MGNTERIACDSLDPTKTGVPSKEKINNKNRSFHRFEFFFF